MNAPTLLCKSRTKTCALTLIEILVCVVIIGILLALLFPAATEFSRRSKDSKCLSNHVKTAMINQPSKSAAFACVIGNYALFHVYTYIHTADPPEANTALGQLAPWHREGTAITFMDGHSELVGAFPSKDKRQN